MPRPLRQPRARFYKLNQLKPVEASREQLEFHARLRAFIIAYLKNGRNATRAAIEVGYSKKNASVRAHQLLRMPEVMAAIKAQDEEAAAVVGLSVNRTLREVARIAYCDPIRMFNDDGSLKGIHEMDPDMRAAIASIEVEQFKIKTGRQTTVSKIKLHNKNDALEKAMRHQGLYGKDNEQRHDIVQTLIVDANRMLDAKFQRLLSATAQKPQAELES